MPVKHAVIAYDYANINGGQAKVAIETARILAEAGIGVTYFTACGEPARALRTPGIELVHLGQNDILSEPNRTVAMTRGIWNREAARQLRSVSARFDPRDTVLHCHGYSKALSASIGPILRDGPLRSLYTMHEYFMACPNGGFYDFKRNEICTRRALSLDCMTTNCDVRTPAHKAWRVLRQAVTWSMGDLPTGLPDVIYISELQRQLMTPYLTPETRLHHLPNPTEFKGEVIDPTGNDILLFIGRLNPEKGAKLFAEAVKQTGLRGVIVGDGPDAEAVRQINPDVTITGWQDSTQVQEWLGRARALVFPSLWYECAPLVVLEALCRGVPVVTGRWTAAADSIEDGRSGILFDRPEPSDLAAALRRVTELGVFDAKPFQQLSRPDIHLSGLLRLYNSILAR